jgi:hypothetical protein
MTEPKREKLSWWAGKSPEDFYKAVKAKSDELRTEGKFGPIQGKGTYTVLGASKAKS